jgi:hypothetical protein
VAVVIVWMVGIFTVAVAQSVNRNNVSGEPLDLRVVAPVPKSLKEASGLELTSSGLLWTHNDDRFAILYGLDTTGGVVKTIHLNHRNKGWEDLTLDSNGNLYIGAFGNNENNRQDLEILKIPPPDGMNDAIVNAEVIRFTYPDQRDFPPHDRNKNFDADAFVSIGDSLYIFTKNRTRPFTGYTKIYRLPSRPGAYEAVLHDSLFLGTDSMLDWVTSADTSPDGRSLVLLSHNRIWHVTGFPHRRFSGGTIKRFNLNSFSHKAGICFDSDNTFYIIDELELGFLGGKIYTFGLPQALDMTEKRPANQANLEVN